MSTNFILSVDISAHLLPFLLVSAAIAGILRSHIGRGSSIVSKIEIANSIANRDTLAPISTHLADGIAGGGCLVAVACDLILC